MAVDRPGVGESQFFKNRVRLNQVLGLLLQVLGQGKQRRRIAQHLLTQFFGLGIKAPPHQLGQVTVQGAHRRADRHVVVVQNDQQIIGAVARVVHRLVGHACGQGPIADDGHRFALAAGLLVRHRHAQCGRNTGRRMCGTKGVVNAFFSSGKTAQAPFLTQRTHQRVAAGQYFVGIGLVAHIPNQAIFGGVEHIVQGNGQFHRPQIGTEMPTGLRHGLHQALAQLLGQRRQVFTRKLFQVRWRLNPFQQSIHGGPEKVIDRPAIYRHFQKRQAKLTLYSNLFKKSLRS